MENGMPIKIKRLVLGMKQKDLAAKLGISPQYLSQIEKGIVKNPRLDIFIGIKRELGIPIEELIFLPSKGRKEVVSND